MPLTIGQKLFRNCPLTSLFSEPNCLASMKPSAQAIGDCLSRLALGVTQTTNRSTHVIVQDDEKSGFGQGIDDFLKDLERCHGKLHNHMLFPILNLFKVI